MREIDTNASTDAAWEEWGRREPYFGVITSPKFRRSEMTENDKREFFESGQWHVNYVMQTIRDRIDPSFLPTSILDFGCGVGRTLVSFAQIASEAAGADVSKSMLQEASTNCRERGVPNVQLFISDDDLTDIRGTFDLIHSCIVFQHIPVARGKYIFWRLLTRLTPGGIGAFQFLYSKSQYVDTLGVPPPATVRREAVRQTPPPGSDPEMQMNPYNMNEILFLIQRAGAKTLYADFTDHGGELGLFLFFKLT